VRKEFFAILCRQLLSPEFGACAGPPRLKLPSDGIGRVLCFTCVLFACRHVC